MSHEDLTEDNIQRSKKLLKDISKLCADSGTKLSVILKTLCIVLGDGIAQFADTEEELEHLIIRVKDMTGEVARDMFEELQEKKHEQSEDNRTVDADQRTSQRAGPVMEGEAKGHLASGWRRGPSEP